MEEVVLMLGSNLNDKERYIKEALQLLRQSLKCLRTSSKYTSKPCGFKSENDFINVAALFECEVSPDKLLTEIIKVENKLGRVRKSEVRYTDRTIDIDIILFGNKFINTHDLIIPHPRFHLRNFCLQPMNEIVPNKFVPGFNKTVNDIYSEAKRVESIDGNYDKV